MSVIAVRGPCCGAGLGLSLSASAQGIIKGFGSFVERAASRSVDQANKDLSLRTQPAIFSESQLIDEKLCSDLIIRGFELTLFEVSGMRDSGAGDTQIGIQAVLQHGKETRPGIAIAYYIKLPSAAQAKGLGTGRIDHNFIGFVSKKIGRTTVDFNAIYLLAGRMTNNGHASSGQAALAASYDLTKRWGIQGEIGGFSRNDSQPGALFALGAVTYQVNRRLILDSGARFGLTADAPRAGAFVGMTVGIADFYKQHRH
jgi:Putative MetA-pathway of phenol degradation